MTYVLDASAVIAIFREEAGKEKVRDILREAENGTASVYMSVVNLIEVSYKFYRDLGKEADDALLERIYRMPIQVQPTIAENVFSEASRLKGTYKMSLGDAIGLATAINLKGVFVSSDGELTEPEAAEHAPVFWFRPPKERQDKKKVDVNAVIRRAEEAERALAEAKLRIAGLEAPGGKGKNSGA
jgi:predicted nucleic acid-binding protein